MRQLNLSLVQGLAMIDSSHSRLHLKFQLTVQLFIIHSYLVNTDDVIINQHHHGEIQNIHVPESNCESGGDNLTLCADMIFETYLFGFSSKLNCRQFDAIISFFPPLLESRDLPAYQFIPCSPQSVLQ